MFDFVQMDENWPFGGNKRSIVWGGFRQGAPKRVKDLERSRVITQFVHIFVSVPPFSKGVPCGSFVFGGGFIRYHN